MGLGKTLVMIANIVSHKVIGDLPRTLVVCPASLVEQWADEFCKHLSEAGKARLKIVPYQGTRRQLPPNARVVITSYGIVQQLDDPLHAVDWHRLVYVGAAIN